MKKFKVILAFTLMFSLLFPSITYANQNNVDYLISVISKGVAAKKWKTVDANIKDMGKLLYQDIEISKLNVKVKSNPIGERLTKVQQRLNEIKAEYKIFNDAYLHYLKARKIKSKEAINDIGVEMINKLSLIGGLSTGGKLTPAFAASNNNAKIIAADLKSIKTLDALGKYIIIRMDSLKPATREAQAERTELDKLNTKFLAMIKKYIKPVPTKENFAWVLVETVNYEGKESIDQTNKGEVYRVSGKSSPGSYSYEWKYIGATDTYYNPPTLNGESYSIVCNYSTPPQVINAGEIVSLNMSMSFSAQNLSYFTPNATTGANFDKWDVKPGFVSGESVSFVNKKGKSSFMISTYKTIKIYSVSDTVTATAPTGVKGKRIALKTSFFPGAKMGTSYIYEWKNVP